MTILIFIYILLVGLIIGSFVNAWVYRIYKSEFAPKSKRQNLSITKGRSACVHCGHRLAIIDLVPVFSWVTLKGRCRYCRKPISRQYPLVELAGAVLAGVSFVLWPFGFSIYGVSLFAIWLILIAITLALIISDVRWMLLPTAMVKPMFITALLWAVLRVASEPSALTGSILGCVALGGLFHIIFIVSNGTWIGGGDVRLGYVIGLVVGGVPQVLMVLFLSSLLGLIYVLLLSLRNKVKRSDHIPFGPSLLAAMFLVVLFKPALDTIFSQVFLLQATF